MMMMNTQRQKQNVQKLPDLQLEQTNQQANLKKLSLDPQLVLLRKCRSDVSYHVCIYFVAEILQFRGLWFFVFMHFCRQVWYLKLMCVKIYLYMRQP